MINVLADKYLYDISSYLPPVVNLTLYDPANGLPDLENINALLIRTVNSVNNRTIPNIPSSLSFVGTASAGSDHIDITYLRKNNVSFSDAAGCNARSVAEYIATALLLWSEKRKVNLSEISIGVIGAGHVGRQVIHLLEKMDIPYLACDPPREIRDENFTSATLDEILQCDILTFHTPLTRDGEYPTYHWMDEHKLSNHQFELILNTSRGGVIDEKALLEAKSDDSLGDIIIDTWKDEPYFHLSTAQQAFIKTPHIAGYSIQAKANASKIVADALLHYFKLDPPDSGKEENSRVVRKDISEFKSLSSVLTALHPIKKYEDELENIICNYPEEREIRFNQLRAEFPLRQEFAHTYLPSTYFAKFPVLQDLGFSSQEISQ